MSKQAVIAKAVLTFLGIMLIKNIINGTPTYPSDKSIINLLANRVTIYLAAFIFMRYFIIKNNWLIHKITTNSTPTNPQFKQLALNLALIFAGLHIIVSFMSGKYAIGFFNNATHFYAYIQDIMAQDKKLGIIDIFGMYKLIEYHLFLVLGICFICIPQAFTNKLIESHLADKGEKK